MAKNLHAISGDARDTGSILGLGKSLGVENGTPVQYSRLKNQESMGSWHHKELDVTEHTNRQCIYVTLLSQVVIPPPPMSASPVLYFCISILCRKKFLIRGK